MAVSRSGKSQSPNGSRSGIPGAPPRTSFAKIREPLEVPNLLALQTDSFDWLVGNQAWQTRQAASGTLAELGERLGATAIIGLVEGSDIVCVASAEPPTGFLHVRYRVGFRHSVSVGAGGLAVLSGMPPQEGERAEVAKARELGYAVSYEELEEGAAAVSAPVLIPHQPIRMSVSVLMPTSQLKDPAEAGRLVIAAAAQVAAMF